MKLKVLSGWRFVFLFFVSFYFLPAQASFSLSQKECFTKKSIVSYNYCIHTPSNQVTNGDVAYMLHGRALDEHTWNDKTYYTSMIQEYWHSKSIVPPTVVTVSFGPIWLLAERGLRPTSGLFELFVGDVIPEVEAKTGRPRQRIVFGESMGGLNSLVVSLKAPHLFAKVAASCPVVYELSPFAPKQQIEEFIKRTNADPKTIDEVLQLGLGFLANEQEWQKFSPLHLIKNLSPMMSPKFYSSCGLYDRYGNFEGNQVLVNSAKSQGLNWTWRPLYGGHCVTDIVSLADFLVD